MKKISWLAILILVPMTRLSSQQTFYYYGPNTRLVDNIEDALSYKKVHQKSDRKYVIRTYAVSDIQSQPILIERIKISNNVDQTVRYHSDNFFPRQFKRTMGHLDGQQYVFREFKGSTLIRSGTSSRFIPLHLEGEVTEYFPDGVLKSISVYRDNQLVSNENWLTDGSKYIDSIFYSADKAPEYKYGDPFFKNYIISSLAESKIDLTQIQDEIIIGWTIMETGEMKGVIALQGKSPSFNNFLVETIEKLPGEWEPAMLNGSAVRYFMTIPINLRQNNAKFQEVELSGGMLHYNSY